MSSSTKTIPILDSLRPYFRALIASGKYTQPITNDYSSLILASESPASIVINKCHGPTYTNQDISPEFLSALIQFAEDVKTIDNKLTDNSPIGLMTSTPSSQVMDFRSGGQGGIIYSVLKEVYDEIMADGTDLKFTDYFARNPNMFSGSVEKDENDESEIESDDLEFRTAWINNKIIGPINKKVSELQVLRNDECRDFRAKISNMNWGNLYPDSPALQQISNNRKRLDFWRVSDIKADIITLLLAKVHEILTFLVRNIGIGCFDIPHHNYVNSKTVRDIINLLAVEDMDANDVELFFTIFEIIGQNAGAGGAPIIIHSLADFRRYFTLAAEDIKNTVRINLRLSETKSLLIKKRPVIAHWIPIIPAGGRIYLDNTNSVVEPVNSAIEMFYNVIGADNWIEEQDKITISGYVKSVKTYSSSIDSKTVLQKCLTSPAGQQAVLGVVQGATAAPVNPNIPPPPPPGFQGTYLPSGPRQTGVPPGTPIVAPKTGVPPPPPPPPGGPRQMGVPPPSGPIGAVRKFLQSQSKPGSVVERYLEVFRFDRNDENEIRQLAAYKNGWTWNSSTGKYSKNLGSTTLEFDPMSADDSTITNFIANQCVALGKTTDCNTILETVLSDNVNARTLNDLLTKSNFSASSSKLESIHPKLAKKVLKNFGFKEVQFTTSFGNKINMIEPVDNWITRFVCTKSELKESCNLLRSAQGKDLRLFLKLLVKAVNEDKKYNTSMSGTSSSRVIDTAAEQAELERLNREYGLPIYKYTGVSAKPSSLSLEEIKRGYGSKMDSIYGLRFDGGLNLIGSPLDFSTASMLPFLMLSAQGLGRVPGFRINLNKPLNFMYTSGMIGGAQVADVFTNEQLDISTGFDLKSNELKKTWDSILVKLSDQLETSYKTKIEQTIDELIQKEASLLNNLARIQKLKQILDIDPSLVKSGSSAGAFTAEDVKRVADTFNTKMDDYRKTFNRASNMLDRLNGQTLMGIFKYTDIE